MGYCFLFGGPGRKKGGREGAGFLYMEGNLFRCGDCFEGMEAKEPVSSMVLAVLVYGLHWSAGCIVS